MTRTLTVTCTVFNVSEIYVPTLIIIFACGGQFYNFINEIWLEMSGKCWKLLWTDKMMDTCVIFVHILSVQFLSDKV